MGSARRSTTRAARRRAPVRKRRTPEEAREEILAAAQRRLKRDGPTGLKLQDVAADVGVSHPAILHYFHSREELVAAVVERAAQELHHDLLEILSTATDGSAGPELMERVHQVMTERQHGRLLAWLALTGHGPLVTAPMREGWRAIIDQTHAARTAGGFQGDREDTAFCVVLSSLALFAMSIAGAPSFDAAGLGTSAAIQTRFREWLAALIAGHLMSMPGGMETPGGARMS